MKIICPTCGQNIYDPKNNICPNCGGNLNKKDSMVYFLVLAIIFGFIGIMFAIYNHWIFAILNFLFAILLSYYSYSEYKMRKLKENDIALYQVTVQVKYKAKNKSTNSPANKVYTCCPYCGSTRPPQIVRRKWSLLTGFLTNKVDRYCVDCKRKY